MAHLAKTYGYAVEPSYEEMLPQRVKRRTLKKRQRKKGRMILCLAVISYIFISFGYWNYKINQRDAQLQALEAQKNAILAEQTKLLEQKELVMSNEYVEKLARENLGLVKPGEKLLLFAEPGEVMPFKAEGSSDLYN